jgi:MarR family transcriptional regulator, transcriptional regulator for hemolysin
MAADAPALASAPLSDNLCWLLGRASQALSAELTAALHDLGLAPRGHMVLLAAESGAWSQTQIARTVGLDKTTMVVTMDELEAAGLAERRPSPTDRRARVIVVTRKGTRLLRKADAIFDAIREDVLATLPAGQRDVLVDALRHLVEGRLSEPATSVRAR